MGGVSKRAVVCLAAVGVLALVAFSFGGCRSELQEQRDEPTTTTVAAVPTTSTSATVDGQADLSVLIAQMAKPYPDGDSRYVSSNPYDYTKDNPAFDAIVAMGYDALEGLEADLTAGGLGNYLDCIAIETITRCDLKQFDQFTWADALTFRSQWNKYLAQMPTMVDAAFMLSSYYPPKPLGLDKLGAPAVPYVIDRALADPGVANPSEVLQTLQTLMPAATPASTIAEFEALNRITLEKLRAYVESHK
jgi:hypothetical protein